MDLVESLRLAPLPRHVGDRAIASARIDPGDRLFAVARELVQHGGDFWKYDDEGGYFDELGAGRVLRDEADRLGLAVSDEQIEGLLEGARELDGEMTAIAAGYGGGGLFEQSYVIEAYNWKPQPRPSSERHPHHDTPAPVALLCLGARHRRASHGTKTVRSGPRRGAGPDDDPDEADPDSLARPAGGPIAPARFEGSR